MRSSPFWSAADARHVRMLPRRFVLLLCSALCVPVFVTAQDLNEEETAEDRAEALLEMIEIALRERVSRRSLLDSVDPSRGRREDRIVAYQLRSTRVAVKLEDYTVSGVLDFLRQMTRINFVISARAQEILQNETNRLSLLLSDLSLESLLNLMDRRLKGLRFTVQYGAVVLVRNDEYRSSRLLRVYYVEDLIRRPRDFPAPRLGLDDLNGRER